MYRNRSFEDLIASIQKDPNEFLVKRLKKVELSADYIQWSMTHNVSVDSISIGGVKYPTYSRAFTLVKHSMYNLTLFLIKVEGLPNVYRYKLYSVGDIDGRETGVIVEKEKTLIIEDDAEFCPVYDDDIVMSEIADSIRGYVLESLELIRKEYERACKKSEKPKKKKGGKKNVSAKKEKGK